MQTANIDHSEIADLVESVDETTDDARIKPDGMFREISAHPPGPYLRLEFDLLTAQAECDEVIPGDFEESALAESIVATLDAEEDATKLTDAVSERTCDLIAEGIAEGLNGEPDGVRHRLDRYAVCTHRHQFEEDGGIATFVLPLGTQWGITRQLQDATIHDTIENELYDVVVTYGDGVVVEPQEHEDAERQRIPLSGNRGLQNGRYAFPNRSPGDLPRRLTSRRERRSFSDTECPECGSEMSRNRELGYHVCPECDHHEEDTTATERAFRLAVEGDTVDIEGIGEALEVSYVSASKDEMGVDGTGEAYTVQLDGRAATVRHLNSEEVIATGCSISHPRDP